MSFNQFVLREQYKKMKGLGDRLQHMKEIIDWKPFIPIVKSVFHDGEIQGGRPHTDEVLVVRMMTLQSWYGMSDEDLEYQIHDRLSFRNFLAFPEVIPDFTTIWKIRERLVTSGKDKLIWDELQRQLDAKGYGIEKGVIQDASFIEADLGKKRYANEKKARKEGRIISYTPKQISHMDQDAAFGIKSNQIHFGYKDHIKTDVGHNLVREIQVTPANVHDNNVDLVAEGDIAAYRDRGYSGSELNVLGVNDMTMIRKDKDKEWVKSLNKAISKIRAPGERPFSVVKRIFNGARIYVKKIQRVFTKEMFKFFAYNLYHLVTLERKKLAIAI